ncbi:polyadenylate-binding protein-interacting protein 2 isoform X1 [Amblyraja radiata]|uniref:polyadenylate-binding protein-interacting protein 2 isoform X1 n=1 Tax=Amblyraja radiata TaxID=386614 RepID=UPI00140315E5|nr:polyadenylate-binding protein-interacting protein 2 isoform X1 [Amblyraja radiata]
MNEHWFILLSLLGHSVPRYLLAHHSALLPVARRCNVLSSAPGQCFNFGDDAVVCQVARMKDPSQNKNIPSINNDDVILNGHSFDDDNPFAEYMWMENEEEFNRQIVEELWEEEFIERCFQEMLEEEEEHEWFIPARDLPQTIGQIQDQLSGLMINSSGSLENIVGRRHRKPSEILENYRLEAI